MSIPYFLFSLCFGSSLWKAFYSAGLIQSETPEQQQATAALARSRAVGLIL